MSMIITRETGMNNVQPIVCHEFGEQVGTGILLSEYPVTVKYHSVSMEDATENWHTPTLIVYSSADGQTPVPLGTTVCVSEKGGNGYKNYCTTRSDAYGIKEMARAYQYESQHLAKGETWADWMEKNKQGVDCSIMAVRYGRDVLVRLENAGVVVLATVLLPDDVKDDVYITLTGEHCTMSDFSAQWDEEPIGEGAIPSVYDESELLEQEEGDLPNIDCSGWWMAHSEGIEITEKMKTITFTSTSFPQAKENWDSPIAVLFSSLDKSVNGVAYREYSVTRANGKGWKENAEVYTNEITIADSWESWGDWLDANKEGMKYTITAVRKRDIVILTISGGGVSVTSYTDIPPSEVLPMCVALSGELCVLTGIRIEE